MSWLGDCCEGWGKEVLGYLSTELISLMIITNSPRIWIRSHMVGNWTDRKWFLLCCTFASEKLVEEENSESRISCLLVLTCNVVLYAHLAWHRLDKNDCLNKSEWLVWTGCSGLKDMFYGLTSASCYRRSWKHKGFTGDDASEQTSCRVIPGDQKNYLHQFEVGLPPFSLLGIIKLSDQANIWGMFVKG